MIVGMMITQWYDISEKPAASIITALIVEVSVLLKQWHTTTKPHSIISQKIVTLTY